MEYRDQIVQGDCVTTLPLLPDKIFRACITSPPYAMQRTGHNSTGSVSYQGIMPEEYPAWTVRWMAALLPKLTDDASVLIVIRPHLKDGQISDYVLRTRLAIRDAGWKECEELIWYKPDAPPLGSYYRPRRSWESILWFSRTSKPFVNLFACGNQKSKRTGGFAGSQRFKDSGQNPISNIQTPEMKEGTSRVSDVFTSYIANIEKGVLHPAMYPTTLTDQLIQTFTEEGDTVVDPFMGSGTTAISAKQNGRFYFGTDTQKEYVDIATKRVLTKNF